jgi:hypothetical protein
MTVPLTGAARVWDAPCRHIDGMAIGTTMAAPHERGALRMLAAQDRTQFGPLRDGYACQYPVEPGVFAWAARTGGFVSRGHAEPGAATLGHTILTIDHFVPDGQVL